MNEDYASKKKKKKGLRVWWWEEHEFTTFEHEWWVHPGSLYDSFLSCICLAFFHNKKYLKKKVRQLFTSESVNDKGAKNITSGAGITGQPLVKGWN